MLRKAGYTMQEGDYIAMPDQIGLNAEMTVIKGRAQDQNDGVDVAYLTNFEKLSADGQEAILAKAFADMQEQYGQNTGYAGASACVAAAWFDDQKQLNATYAHLGNCTAYLVWVFANGGPVRITKLNENLHQASLGQDYRVMRALGNSSNASTDSYAVDIDRWGTHSPVKQAYLVVASSGLNVLNHQNILDAFIHNPTQGVFKPVRNLSYELAKQAYELGSQGNISVAVVPVVQGKVVSAAVFDGFGNARRLVSNLEKYFYPSIISQLPKQVTRVEVASDFDGTMTGVDGRHVIFNMDAYSDKPCIDIDGKDSLTGFYKQLLLNPADGYKSALKRSSEVQRIMREEFARVESETKTRDPRRLTHSAVIFLRQVLRKVPGMEFRIVTKNNIDYVRALLAVEGFTPAEIKRIVIVDKNRQQLVSEITREHVKLHKRHIMEVQMRCYDDDESGIDAMWKGYCAGAGIDDENQENNYKEGMPTKEAPIDWLHEMDDIRATLGLTPAVMDADLNQLRSICDDNIRRLQGMQSKYHGDEKGTTAQSKENLFKELLAILDRKDISNLEKAVAYAEQLEKSEHGFKTYPDPYTQKAIKAMKIILATVFFVIPALVLAGVSYRQTGSFRFWQTEDEAAVAKMKRSLKSALDVPETQVKRVV